MTKITTIIFDLAEVLLTGLLGMEDHLAPRLKLKKEDIQNQLLHGKESASLFHGEITEEEYWQQMVKKNNWNISTKELKEIVRANFKEIPGTRKIIQKLKDKGYKLGLLSVHTKEWIDHCLMKFDHHKLFHATAYSFEVHVSKPDKKAYESILQKLNAKPEECLFIDDSLKNTIAAKEIGMQTIQFKNAEQLKEELAKLSININ